MSQERAETKQTRIRFLIGRLRTVQLGVPIIALQLVIIGLICMGVGQPREVYAWNVPEDYGQLADAAHYAKHASDQVDAVDRQLSLVGVRCH